MNNKNENINRSISRIVIVVGVFLLFAKSAKPQFFAPSDTLHKSRLIFASTVATAGYGASVVGLYQLWYKDYEQSKFHFFNDNKSWLQMDKAGHALTGYQLARYGYETMKWTGVKEPTAVWIGSNFGLLFLTTIELMDGFSAEWGFSYGDALANVAGTAGFIAQQLAWQEQRVVLKFSFSKSKFAQYRPEVLGHNRLENILKDYNGQTYWLSINPSSFSQKEKKFLPWLNIALGYSANGMLGGDFNPNYNAAGQELPFAERYRQYYLSLDIDLTRIKTQNHFLQSVFSVVGFLKIPAPAIEFSQNKLKWHWMKF